MTAYYIVFMFIHCTVFYGQTGSLVSVMQKCDGIKHEFRVVAG